MNPSDDICKRMYMGYVPVNDKPTGVPASLPDPGMFALKTPDQIMKDIQACIRQMAENESAERPLPNVIPKSLWVQLSEFERLHYRYPRWEDEPIGSKRRRRERRQDLKHGRTFRVYWQEGTI